MGAFQRDCRICFCQAWNRAQVDLQSHIGAGADQFLKFESPVESDPADKKILAPQAPGPFK